MPGNFEVQWIIVQSSPKETETSLCRPRRRSAHIVATSQLQTLELSDLLCTGFKKKMSDLKFCRTFSAAYVQPCCRQGLCRVHRHNQHCLMRSLCSSLFVFFHAVVFVDNESNSGHLFSHSKDSHTLQNCTSLTLLQATTHLLPDNGTLCVNHCFFFL